MDLPNVHSLRVQHKAGFETHHIRLGRCSMFVVEEMIVLQPTRLLGEVIELDVRHVLAVIDWMNLTVFTSMTAYFDYRISTLSHFVFWAGIDLCYFELSYVLV